MTKFGKFVVWSLIIIFIAIVAGLSYYYYLQNFSSANIPKKVLTSFEDCAAAGYPIMESSPRMCMDELGNSFSENLPENNASSTATSTKDLSDRIILTSPLASATVTSPVLITGKARGNWFFEASFPVFITDWDGKIIGQGVAQADGDWMTEDFVPFKVEVSYTLEKVIYSKRGTLILKKDNPSGEPEFDEALEIPINLQ